jgi:tape measure domain-containing protein
MFGGGLEAFRLYGTVGVDTKPAQRGLDDLSQHTQRSSNIITSAMGTALGFLGGQYMMQAINTGVGAIKGAAIDYNAAMEQATIGFTTLLGSAEKAGAFIEELEAFAARTPFEFRGLQSAANQMLAMGFASEDILPTLTAVGDAVAALGLGTEGVNSAVRALGQMRSAGRVTAQDMMQLTSLGIPAWQMLADSMGKTVPEVRRLSEQGLIPAQQAIDAITTGIESGNMGGMMAAQAHTFTGAMSTIKDSLTMATGKALKPFFEMLSNVAIKFADWLQTPGATAFFDGIAGAITTAADALGGFFGIISNIITVFTGSDAQGMVDAFGALPQPIKDVIRFVKPLVEQLVEFLAPAIEVVMDNLDTIAGIIASVLLPPLKILGPIFEGLSSGATDVGAAIGTAFTSGLEQLGAFAMEIVPVLADLAGKIADWVIDALPGLLANLASFLETALGWFLDNLPAIIGQLAEWGAALIGWIAPRIPEIIGALVGFLAEIGGWILTEGVPKLIKAAAELGGSLIKGIMDFVTGADGGGGLLGRLGDFIRTVLIPGLVALIPKLAKAGADLAIGLGKAFANGLVGLIEGAVNAMIGGINKFQIHFGGLDLGPLGRIGRVDWWGFQLPLVRLPRFEQGAWELPQTMAAVLHRGEMVLPRDVAERMRSMLSEGRRSLASPVTIQVSINNFYGTEANVDALSRALAERARAARF